MLSYQYKSADRPFLNTKNMIEKMIQYFKDSYAEMKKVTWPTKKQTINYSALVIAMSVGMAVFFSVLDYVFNLGLTKLITQ